MKKVIKSILKNMIFYALIISTIFIFSKKIINDYNMEFRNWFYITVGATTFLFFIIGIIQIICKMKDKLIKTFIIITLLVFTSVILGISYLFYTITVSYEEQLLEKKGKKLVGHIYSYMSTKIEYYKYINFIVRGKDRIFYEEL